MPGEMTITKKQVILSTVLGSCVSVWLYDQAKKISGINHYLLPVNNKNDHEINKYGDTSLEKMLQVMISMGAEIRYLSAHIFGGASMFSNKHTNFGVGQKNVQIAEQFLQKYKIRVVSAETGGTTGRKVTIHLDTGKVEVKSTAKDIPEIPI